MRSKLIKQIGHPILREVTPEIEEITDAEVTVANKLKLALATVDGYAVAANQMGYNSRIFAYKIDRQYKVILNPRLSEYSDKLWLFNEGCLSIPGFYFPVWRPKKVLLRGIDLDGNDIRIEANDLLGRIFQHEIDHLFGKLVIDKLNPEELEAFNKTWKQKKQSTLSKSKKK